MEQDAHKAEMMLKASIYSIVWRLSRLNNPEPQKVRKAVETILNEVEQHFVRINLCVTSQDVESVLYECAKVSLQEDCVSIERTFRKEAKEIIELFYKTNSVKNTKK
jgi:hypothetical protein